MRAVVEDVRRIDHVPNGEHRESTHERHRQVLVDRKAATLKCIFVNRQKISKLCDEVGIANFMDSREMIRQRWKNRL